MWARCNQGPYPSPQAAQPHFPANHGYYNYQGVNNYTDAEAEPFGRSYNRFNPYRDASKAFQQTGFNGTFNYHFKSKPFKSINKLFN